MCSFHEFAFEKPSEASTACVKLAECSEAILLCEFSSE